MAELYFIYAGIVFGWCLCSFADETTVATTAFSIAAGLLWPVSVGCALWRLYTKKQELHQP